MVQRAIWLNGPLRPHYLFVIIITHNIGYTRRSRCSQSKDKILEAIQSFESKEFHSIRSTASHFNIPYQTL